MFIMKRALRSTLCIITAVLPASRLQVGGVDEPFLGVALAEHLGDGHRLVQLAAEGNTAALDGAGARVVELLEDHVGGAGGGVPSGPTLRLDNVAQLAVLPDDLGVRAPRTTQDGRVDAALAEHAGTIEDVRSRAVGGFAAAGGDETRADGLDVAGLEPGLSVAAEDEVGGAVDVRLGVELSALVCQHGVLVSSEVTTVKAVVRGVHVDGQRLADVAGRVGDVEVVHLHVVRLETHRAGHVVTGLALHLDRDVLLGLGLRDRHLVASVRRRIAREALQHQRARQWRDEHLLVVDARTEEKGLLRRRVGVQPGHALRHRLEAVLVGARGIHDDGARWRRVARVGPTACGVSECSRR
ncbi:hypothetical protein ON010_g2796 [Phytophthora cinnamomi]|nr:hypothetical protein ON010_g2796 [Phytophthora cinnamomi]